MRNTGPYMPTWPAGRRSFGKALACALLACGTWAFLVQGEHAARQNAQSSARAQPPAVNNPHIQVDDNDRVDYHTCVVCHLYPFPRNTRIRRDDGPYLLADEVTVCGRCHASHLDYFDPGHIGAKVNDEIHARLLAYDNAAGLPQPKRRKGPVQLPLADERTVVCSTCHNPHQHGLFPSGSELVAGAMKDPGASDSTPLRVPARDLCFVCHNK